MPPSVFVIFGATGDLTHRKLIPAALSLFEKGRLPEIFAIVGVARKDMTTEEFRSSLEASAKQFKKHFSAASWKRFSQLIHYFKNDFDTEGSYPEMKLFMEKIDQEYGTAGNRVLYLATMPRHFENIINLMKRYDCIKRTKDRTYRIVIEKPFGTDLKSATDLNEKLSALFHEKEIFRIDHYLGKETVQNLFALRFANRIFEPVWNSKHIDNVQITVAESLGVEGRGGYYDGYGATKDMIQNHLLQILSIFAMEPPKEFESEAIKDKKVALLTKIKLDSYQLGQYNGYAQEPGVAPGTKTETYSAVKLHIDTPRWKGTPFYLRTGKKLARKASEIVVRFKDCEYNLFDVKSNVLVIRLQPDEGIYLRFNAKEPGTDFKITEVSMDFCHECLFPINTPEAYEKLIFDAFSNDRSLFSRWDEVASAWKLVDRIDKSKPVIYEQGSWGPPSFDDMTWREPL
ncbi:MAG: glucose-6-phosphate dehydrogenase [Nanoarchaeota archaeon]|nr:glucose-6-phosphate dehydrogenase [Nanoarchaeota archaeon]